MHKVMHLTIISTLVFLLCSCSEAGVSSSFEISSAISPISFLRLSSSTNIYEEATHPAPSQAIIIDNKALEKIYRTFLSENYQKLSDAFFSGISGIGFIDLDMDGGIEMLILDAGASAAMGLQFFDIIDGSVECVSANMDTVGTIFGGKHMSNVIVNANTFDSFRLVKNKSTGEKFFIIQSGNGAVDFCYSELVRFGTDNGILTLTSLMYKHEDYDMDSRIITGENFKVNGEDADRSTYEYAYCEFFSNVTDTGYIAKGVFMGENADYELSLDGLVAMTDKALTLYESP